MYRTLIPSAVPALFPKFLWAGSGSAVHLTFDDGPHPEWTPFVLDELGKHGQKGTFFCVGENIQRHPKIFQRIRQEGHSWGNHTMGHESGWNTPDFTYFRSFLECEAWTGTGLFRPPYGRITRSQAQAIGRHSQVVMWNLLTGDFDRRRSGESCLSATLHALTPGTIAVMHDSDKAGPRLKILLPGVLHHLKLIGVESAAIGMKPKPAKEDSHRERSGLS